MLNTAELNRLKKQLDALKGLLSYIGFQKTPQELSEALDSFPPLRDYIAQEKAMGQWLETLEISEKVLLKKLFAIGQGPYVFHGIDPTHVSKKKIAHLLLTLAETDRSYDILGGIIGYQIAILELILGKAYPEPNDEQYLKPEGVDISQDTQEVRRAIRFYIEHCDEMAEIYPVGGAGDRLDLKDEKTNTPLPSAELLFLGRTLLEGLIRDLQAREYLHYKLMGRQIVTPIAMMTSHEKNNHAHILEICNRDRWFGRPISSYCLVTQPLVPVVTVDGRWVSHGPLNLMLKPGGHGVLWKLMLDLGVFKWLQSLGRTKGFVRQINNPIAGTDTGLSAFLGLGLINRKAFGFSSCPRLVDAAEGMNVVIKKQRENGFYAYRLTNVEYTEFHKKGIPDEPDKPGSLYSKFPANTNILFVDLHTIQDAIKRQPVPGMLINMKHSVTIENEKGEKEEIKASRLESTMQNIADEIEDLVDHNLSAHELKHLKSYLTYNERKKTISVTKNAHRPGKPIHETPEGCFYDFLNNHRDLLTQHCKMEVPALGSEEDWMNQGPNFLVYFHPALGPYFNIIAQKIQGGALKDGAEVQLEIAELAWKNLELDGSLHIIAEQVLGHTDADGILCYSEQCGRCVLKNVKVANRGIDRSQQNRYWKKELYHLEKCEIILKGCSEFYAEDVTLQGNQAIVVPDGHKMTAKMENERVVFKLEKIERATWQWMYRFDSEDRVVCEMSTPP